MPPPEPRRRLAIEVHDVAPATWPECEAILRTLDAVGASHVTLLVVPRFHHGVALAAAPAFLRALEARLARGDELALHGYYHLDLAAPPRTARAYVQRRLMTRAEGEFAAIDEHQAVERIARGAQVFAALGWPLYGFVPPAWLLGAPARRALERCGYAFEYVGVRGGVYRLPSWRFGPCANLWYSPDKAWRRALSRVQIRRELARARSQPMLRMSIHPQDARVPQVMDHWRRLATDALATREPVTKREWASLT